MLKGGYGAVIRREHPVLTCRRFILVVYLNKGAQVAFQGLQLLLRMGFTSRRPHFCGALSRFGDKPGGHVAVLPKL